MDEVISRSSQQLLLVLQDEELVGGKGQLFFTFGGDLLVKDDPIFTISAVEIVIINTTPKPIAIV
jgi:hypothetical protein